MKNRLSRKKTRLAIILMVVGMAVIVGGIGLMERSMVLSEIVAFSGLGVFFAALALWPTQCPACGERGRYPAQWSQPGRYHCVHCGAKLAYDDEEERL